MCGGEGWGGWGDKRKGGQHNVCGLANSRRLDSWGWTVKREGLSQRGSGGVDDLSPVTHGGNIVGAH